MIGKLLRAAMLSGLPVVVEVVGAVTLVGKVDLYDPRDGRVVLTQADGDTRYFYDIDIMEVRYA